MTADSKTISSMSARQWLVLALMAIVTGVIVVDIVYVVYVRGQLQVATDASATAGARGLVVSADRVVADAIQNAQSLRTGAMPASLVSDDVELGFWDASSRRFATSAHWSNAVRVTARGGAESLLLGRLFGVAAYNVEVSTVAIVKPRDIVFVIDLSGKMNNEPGEHLYDDLGWNEADGQVVTIDPSRFTKAWGDALSSESDRHAAIAWIIDHQIAAAMPHVKPTVESSSNDEYWATYLRFLTADCDSAQSSKRIGYRTYLQFMLAQGRDQKPDGRQYTPLSSHSPDGPTHEETVGNRRFDFPPRCQPMHDVRRALIGTLQTIKRRNSTTASNSTNTKDRVAIVTFDRLIGGGPRIAARLSDDYDAAMDACAKLQAVGDRGHSSAVEAGLARARELLKKTSHGGSGRSDSEKRIVFLSGSTPDLFISTPDDLRRRMLQMGSLPYYNEQDRWLNAPMLLAAEMRAESKGPTLHVVGVGRQADIGFLQRLSEIAFRGVKDLEPTIADGEKHLVEVLERILSSGQATIVQ